MTTTAKHPWLGLIGWIAICFLAAGIGSAATTPNIASWYASLAKPSWTPPNWLFGPVWSILYGCMAVAAWLVWRQSGFAGSHASLGAFGIQLLANVCWSWCFFGLHGPGIAFWDIIFLWLAIAVTLILFWRCSIVAGALLLPYLAWVSFAGVLNFAIWRMNG
jgi:translocator protein